MVDQARPTEEIWVLLTGFGFGSMKMAMLTTVTTEAVVVFLIAVSRYPFTLCAFPIKS